MDGCGDNGYYQAGYRAMGAALAATGRDIVYSCSWPAYIGDDETTKPFAEFISDGCNLWYGWLDTHTCTRTRNAWVRYILCKVVTRERARQFYVLEHILGGIGTTFSARGLRWRALLTTGATMVKRCSSGQDPAISMILICC